MTRAYVCEQKAAFPRQAREQGTHATTFWCPQVQAALSREGKEQTVTKVKELMDKSTFMCAFTYPGMSVSEGTDWKALVGQES